MSETAVTAEPTRRPPRPQAWWNAVHAWLLLLPAAVLLVAFTHYPVLATLRHSFFIARRGGGEVFVGLDNYRAMAADPIFWKVLVNNLWFALGTIPTSIALALVMALWVNRNMRGRGFLRLAYFTPTVLPMIAVANIWLFFYTPDYGLLDQLRGLFGLAGWNWLGDPRTVMGCLIVMVIWKEAGFFMIFYLAALQQLPPDLEEAAAVEGADAKSLRDTLDRLKDKFKSAAIVLGSVDAGKVTLIAGVTSDLTSRLKAGELVNHVATQVGGKGGGRPDMAQAGGTQPDKLPAALASVKTWVEQRL